jgi:hypothetical protein
MNASRDSYPASILRYSPGGTALILSRGSVPDFGLSQDLPY